MQCARIGSQLNLSSLQWNTQEIDLTKLQLNIVRKLHPDEIGDAEWSLVRNLQVCEVNSQNVFKLTSSANTSQPLSNKSIPASLYTFIKQVQKLDDNIAHGVILPSLEWPRNSSDVTPNTDEFDFISLLPKDKLDLHISPVQDDEESSASNRNASVWDPSNVIPFVEYDPYKTLKCEVCDLDTDGSRMLICEKCEKGYHMYCCQPVIVTIPKEMWICSQCRDEPLTEEHTPDFCKAAKGGEMNETEIASILNLPYNKISEFHVKFSSSIRLMNPKADPAVKRERTLKYPSSKSVKMINLFGLHYSIRIEKNNWVLPIPIVDAEDYVRSVGSIALAVRASGMKAYSESLVYNQVTATEAMNSSSFENVQPLPNGGEIVFAKFLENLRLGLFPPIIIERDARLGFGAKALREIPRHTMLMEYSGEVKTAKACENSDSDSLMLLVDTGNPDTTLFIDPSEVGNAARFLNGINNRCEQSRRNANVRSRRFEYCGQCRILLYTVRRVKAGDFLTYDYNAGMEGKTDKEWAKSGFYDTSNFF